MPKSTQNPDGCDSRVESPAYRNEKSRVKLILHFQLTNLEFGCHGKLINSQVCSSMGRECAARTAPAVSEGLGSELSPGPPVLPLLLMGTSSSGHHSRIQSFHHLLQKAGVRLPPDFLPRGNMRKKKNRFVKVIQRFERSEPTEFSKLPEAAKVPWLQSAAAQGSSELLSGKETVLHNPFSSFSRDISTSVSSHCLFQAAHRKNLQGKSQFSQEVHPTPQ